MVTIILDQIYAVKKNKKKQCVPLLIGSDYTIDPHWHQFYRLYSKGFYRLVEYKEITHGLLSGDDSCTDKYSIQLYIQKGDNT